MRQVEWTHGALVSCVAFQKWAAVIKLQLILVIIMWDVDPVLTSSDFFKSSHKIQNFMWNLNLKMLATNSKIFLNIALAKPNTSVGWIWPWAASLQFPVLTNKLHLLLLLLLLSLDVLQLVKIQLKWQILHVSSLHLPSRSHLLNTKKMVLNTYFLLKKGLMYLILFIHLFLFLFW